MSTRPPAYRITSARSRMRRDRARVWRGLLAVVILLVSAVDALVTAVIGIPPIGWMWRRVSEVIRAEAFPPGSPPAIVSGRVIPSDGKDMHDG